MGEVTLGEHGIGFAFQVDVGLAAASIATRLMVPSVNRCGRWPG